MQGIYWPTFFFWLFAAVTCGFAVAVLVSSNIVRMAFYLVLSLAASAMLFFLAGADFVGAMQLLIYVGGTLVLLIFGVMLTSQARFISMKISNAEWGLSLTVGGCLLAVLAAAAFAIPEWSGLPRAEAEQLGVPQTATPLGMALLGARVDVQEPAGQAPADRPPSGYLLIFEIISVHLLVVLVGAAYLARAKRKTMETIG